MAYINGVLSYGRVMYVDNDLDFVEVHAVDFSTPTAELYVWTGSRAELQELWTFAPHHGDA